MDGASDADGLRLRWTRATPPSVSRQCSWRGTAMVAGVCFALLAVSNSDAAPKAGQATPSEAQFIGEIIVLLLAGRLLGELMQRAGQPAIMGQLIAGVLLGPSVFGAFWPEAQLALFGERAEQKAMVEAVSALGILMLLLLTGMETDLYLVLRARRAAVKHVLNGVVCGSTFGQFLP